MITIARPDWRWDPWREIDRVQRDASSIFTLPRRRPEAAYPPMNIHTGEEDVIITAEIPGIDPADIDLTVTGDTLTIRGTRKAPGSQDRVRPGIAGNVEQGTSTGPYSFPTM